MATPHDGEKSDAVSPSVKSASDKARNQKTTRELFQEFILGNYVGGLPALNVGNLDGNIFSVLGAVQRAWRHTDRDVASRLAEVFNFAMSGHFQNGDEPTRAELARRAAAEAWGYDELLGTLLSVCDCVDEDEDEDSDDEDEDCDGLDGEDEVS